MSASRSIFAMSASRSSDAEMMEELNEALRHFLESDVLARSSASATEDRCGEERQGDRSADMQCIGRAHPMAMPHARPPFVMPSHYSPPSCVCCEQFLDHSSSCLTSCSSPCSATSTRPTSTSSRPRRAKSPSPWPAPMNCGAHRCCSDTTQFATSSLWARSRRAPPGLPCTERSPHATALAFTLAITISSASAGWRSGCANQIHSPRTKSASLAGIRCLAN